MTDKINSRNLVLTMLTETLDKGSLSNLVLNDAFKKYSLSTQDKKFISKLYLGTLEKAVYLDFIIDNFSKTKTEKMKPVIRNILRMGVYQLLFMDSVPERAALSESLKLCDKRKISGLKGFVNGVLRAITKNDINFDIPDYAKASLPLWLYEKIVSDLGEENSKLYFDAINNKKPLITVRIVFEKNDKEVFKKEVKESLLSDGCTVKEIPFVFEALKISDFDALTELKAFKNGWIIVQDLSSQLVSKALEFDELKDKEITIIDVCAAPGGKSLHLADIYQKAAIFAFDQNKYKTSLIEENKKRLNIFNIQTNVHDSRETLKELENKADIVVADLPCSGLGTINEKPDIRTRIKEDDFDELIKLQREILKASEKYVKPGGLLLFSTCTVNPGENIENAFWFKNNFDFDSETLEGNIPDCLLTEEQRKNLKSGCLQLINGVNETNGFFISLFRKNK